MEDAHSFVYDFGGIRGQGYFAVFEYVAVHRGLLTIQWSCWQTRSRVVWTKLPRGTLANSDTANSSTCSTLYLPTLKHPSPTSSTPLSTLATLAYRISRRQATLTQAARP